MSPEDLQGQVARSAAVERELREEIGKLRAELAEAKTAAARTCYQGGTAAGEVLAKMQAEHARLEEERSELRKLLRDLRQGAIEHGQHRNAKAAQQEADGGRCCCVGCITVRVVDAVEARWPESDNAASQQPNAFRTAALAACAYLAAQAALAAAGTSPERPDAARRLAEAWIALTRACRVIQPAVGPAQDGAGADLPRSGIPQSQATEEAITAAREDAARLREWLQRAVKEQHHEHDVDEEHEIPAQTRCGACGGESSPCTDLRCWVPHAIAAIEGTGGPTVDALVASGLEAADATGDALGEAVVTAYLSKIGDAMFGPALRFAAGSLEASADEQFAASPSAIEACARMLRKAADDADDRPEARAAHGVASERAAALAALRREAQPEPPPGIPLIDHDYVPTPHPAVDACDKRVSDDPDGRNSRQCGRPRREHRAEAAKPAGDKP